jgi:ABC-type phosphate transport system substrate-binding protein
MRRSVTSVILGVGLLALTACGSSDTTQEAATEPSSTSVAQTTEPLTSDSVAESLLQEVSANIIGTQTSFSLTAALAESPVVFWFWAPG